MKKRRASFVLLALAAVCVSVSPDVHAFTLGELRGTAVIGRALDVSVRVQADPTEDLSAACFAAEVFHADARQITPQLSVTSTTAGEAVVRVRSAALVDEPVVSLELQTRCGAAATRRYVLLADIAPAKLPLPVANVQPALVAAPTVAVSAPAASAPAKAASAAVNTLPDTVAAAVGTVPNRQPKQGKPAVKKAARPAANASQPAAHPGSKAVLKLDPFELFSDRIAALDASMLFEPTADALLQARKVTDMQNDVKLLREQVAKSNAQLLDLQAQLQLAQSQQMSPVWFYALFGTVLAGLGALAWLLWQQRQARRVQGDSWHDALPWPVAPVPATAKTAPALQPAPAPAAAPEPVTAPPAKPQPEATPATPLNAQWYAATPEVVPPTPAELPKTPAGNPASSLMGLHSFNIEPILDIRQQAEFFVSLGQTDRALHILTQQISGSSEPNPFIYLDLLALLHSLGMKAEFREYRQRFNQHFSGAMPDFAAFHLEGRDLLDYPEMLERLVKGWPSARTLMALNGWIFRKPNAATHVSFDLAAFRDLLMLHALAEELALDLTWDPTSQPWPVGAKMAAELGDAHTSVAPVANITPSPAVPATQPPDASQDTSAQVLDMDFSMFDTGTFGLAPSTRTQPLAAPRTEETRARWPTKDLR